MEYSIFLVDDGRTDVLRGLGAALLGREELHGRVRFVEAPPPPDAMGPVVSELQVILGNQAHLQAVGGVLVTWLVARRRTIKLKLARKGTEAEFTLTNTTRDTEAAVRELIARIADDQARNPELEAKHPDGGS